MVCVLLDNHFVSIYDNPVGKISLILPVYNESAVLQEVLAKYIKDLKSQGISYEIIAVNDGSTDDSVNILHAAAKLNRSIKVITLDGRYGKQAAITAGFDAADKNAEAVILADIDVLNPTGILKRVIDEYQNGNSIVYAKRENFGVNKMKATWSDNMVMLGSKIYGIDGKYTGKAHVALYARAVADVIRVLPARNKYLRTMDNWVGWQIKYIDYASGYNNEEAKRYMKDAGQQRKKRGVSGSELPVRDKVREHTYSLDLAIGFLTAAVLAFIFGIFIAILGKVHFGFHIFAWLMFLACMAIAAMFYLRAVLIKRVGVLHNSSQSVYIVKE